MSRTLGLIGGLMAGGLALWLAQSPHEAESNAKEAPQARTATAPNDASEELHAELARLRNGLARLERHQKALVRDVQAPEADDEADNSQAQRESEPVTPLMTPRQARAAQTELLEERLSGEGVDRDAEHQLRERLLEQPLVGALDTAVECGGSLCRIEVGFDSLDARDDGLAALPTVVPWNYDAYYRAADEDERRMIVYLTREGEPLPTIAEASHGRQ